MNKSQVQSFDEVGIYIHRPLFLHGQLYVALSRGRDPKKIYIQNSSDNHLGIKSIVWKEVFN